MFADIRGYTAYMREHGDEAGARVAQQPAAAAEQLASEFGGSVPRLRGDEALVIFDSARGALRYALALQRRLADDGMPLGVGIGLDAGEAVVGEEDLHGGGLNLGRAAVLAGEAGEVLATDGVVHLAGRFDEARYGLRRLERLKGFDQPVGIVEVHPGDRRPAASCGGGSAAGCAGAVRGPGSPRWRRSSPRRWCCRCARLRRRRR